MTYSSRCDLRTFLSVRNPAGRESPPLAIDPRTLSPRLTTRKSADPVMWRTYTLCKTVDGGKMCYLIACDWKFGHLEQNCRDIYADSMDKTKHSTLTGKWHIQPENLTKIFIIIFRVTSQTVLLAPIYIILPIWLKRTHVVMVIFYIVSKSASTCWLKLVYTQ